MLPLLLAAGVGGLTALGEGLGGRWKSIDTSGIQRRRRAVEDLLAQQAGNSIAEKMALNTEVGAGIRGQRMFNAGNPLAQASLDAEYQGQVGRGGRDITRHYAGVENELTGRLGEIDQERALADQAERDRRNSTVMNPVSAAVGSYLSNLTPTQKLPKIDGGTGYGVGQTLPETYNPPLANLGQATFGVKPPTVGTIGFRRPPRYRLGG